MSARFADLISSFRAFLKKIRRSDEKTRRTWFLGGVTVSMLLVIGIWMLSLNVNVRSALPEDTTPARPFEALKEESSGNSILETFKRGVSYIERDVSRIYSSLSDSVESTFSSFKSRIDQRNEIYVEGRDIQFSPDSLEIIPPTPLPYSEE